MKLPQRGGWKGKYLLTAFLIPFCGMLLVMLISGYKPFGKYSMLYSDMYHQYYPFFVAYRRALLSGDSLLYSWNVGMGMDYLGLISYYLASPLNLLSVLVPEKFLLSYFSLIMPVKLGLAGLFFAVFLKNIFSRNDMSIAVFGGFYGLCAWALGYQWNIMWLDTFALLPLAALGTIWLIRDKKFVLYTVVLFLSVFSNYYIGFFTCIFIALLFFCYEICRPRGWKRFFLDLGRIALFSALAIGMTAILELPALAALQTTQSSVNAFPKGFRLNIATKNTVLGLLDAMRQVAGNMGGALEPSFKEGLPNLYCGVGTILLGLLFLISGQVKLRDKLCCVFLLLFFNLSFIIRQLDYIWHGFHFTNMIPYRFSFLYSFVMLYMAYRAWLVRRRFDTLQILSAGFLTGAILCCSGSLTDVTAVECFGRTWLLPVYAMYNFGFLALYLVMFLVGRVRIHLSADPSEEELASIRLRIHNRRRLSAILAMGVMVCELAATLISFGLYFPGTGVSNYPKGTEDAASMVRYIGEREKYNLFYRAETTHSQTLNDGALNGYNGISTFTSSANVHTTEFMKALGYGAKNTYNRYCFEESSPVANLFLGLKYMLERDGRDRSSTYFEDVIHFGQVHLLENKAYLPLGFLADSELADVDFSMDSTVFAFQNELFRAATGVEQDVWRRLSGDDTVYVDPTGVEVSETTSSGYCAYDNATSGSTISYWFTADQAGFLCIHLNLPKRNDFVVSLNGAEVYTENISLPQMLAVADVVPGDLVEVQIRCKDGESGTMTVSAGILDPDIFDAGYAVLSASTLELTKFRNTLVEGIIDCDRDGLLYTSIPQNGNWHVYVDGVEQEIQLVGDCMISVPVTMGTHTVRIVYRNAAFNLGWKVSLGCLVVFLVITWAVYRPKKDKQGGEELSRENPEPHE